MVRQASASSRDCCAATSSGSPGSCGLRLTALITVIAARRCSFRLHTYSWQAACLNDIGVHIRRRTWSAPRAIGVGSSDASSLSTCAGHHASGLPLRGSDADRNSNGLLAGYSGMALGAWATAGVMRM